MPDPYRLSMVIDHVDGTTTRWGPDELDAARVPTGLSFSTTSPGGFSDLQCELLRRIDLDHPDLNTLDQVTVYGPGTEIVWQGRMAQFPRQTDDGYSVEPGAEGWVAHLRDDETFREVYVDRNPGSWGDWFALRVQYAGSNDMASFSTETTGGLVFSVPNQATVGTELAFLVYQAPAGVQVGKVQYKGTNTDIPVGYLAADIRFASNATDMAAGTGTYQSVALTLDATVRTATATTARRYVALVLYANGSTALPAEAMRRYDKIAVYGDHGLTLRSNDSEPDGVYASDVLVDVISRAAPMLTYSTGQDGSITATTIPISHLTFPGCTIAEDVIKRCNAFHLWDWGVYNNREFYFRQPDPERLTWTIRLDQGTRLTDDGPAGVPDINGVMVSYQDPAGEDRLAGPPGSDADTEDAGLQNLDPANSVNAHGAWRKWVVLGLSDVSTDADAVAIGTAFLNERSVPQRRGQASVTGMVEHPTQGLRPAWAIRAGDYVQFVDTLDDSISDPRRVIKTDYDHDNRSNSLSLDSTPYTLDALLELLNAELASTQ